jgi:nicotinate-nucleotide pyrophosphorylase (carboxylating)
MNTTKLLIAALKEDAPIGDLTCLSLNLPKDKTFGHFIAKQDLVLSGADFITAISNIKSELVTHNIDPIEIDLELFFSDGHKIKKGQKIAQLYGPWNQLVLVERAILNIIGHLSGIATLTQQFVKQVEHTKCKILDTRKTTPLFRSYEKKAVVDGGGTNHRINLSDEIMLKENHICRLTDSLSKTLIQLKKENPKIKITVECQTLKEVLEVSKTPVDQILLDNMDNEMLIEAVKIIPKNIKSEASGNMSLSRVKSVAETGVDYISVGAITHSAPVADISFLIDK